ncbi:hypothetical protein C5C13_10925 [Clavibacter michiganensis]|nr:hypothetical protein C5C13_10925 [Clavibacter michiganensis]
MHPLHPRTPRRRARHLLVPLALGLAIVAGTVVAPAPHATAATPAHVTMPAPAMTPAQVTTPADAVRSDGRADPDDTQFLDLIWTKKGPGIGSVLLTAGKHFAKCVEVTGSALFTVTTGTYRITSYFGSGCRPGRAHPRSAGLLPATGTYTVFYVSATAPPAPIAV